MNIRHSILTTLALAIASLAGADGLVAQDPQAPAQPPAAQQQVEVTEELLERFVGVYPEVLEVSQQAQAQIATATEPAQAQEIQTAAQAQIMAVLDEQEMSPTEYQAVVDTLSTDEALRERFMLMLEERQGDPNS